MKKYFFGSIFVLLLSSLACSLPFGASAPVDSSSNLPETSDDSYSMAASDDALLAPVGLSGAQRQVLSVWGNPDRFMLRFSAGLREETWYYDADGYDITFRNGETFTENQWDPVPANLVLKTGYTPWLFNQAMGLTELLAVSGSPAFTIEHLDEVFGEEVSLVALAGLDAGFRNGKLLFVRAIPLGRALPQAGPGDPNAESTGLTAVEQSHAGTHTYQVYCLYSDGTSEEYEGMITWRFAEEGLYFDEEGPFPWIKENGYGITDDTGSFFFYFQENNITITGETISIGEGGAEILDTMTCILDKQ